MSSSPAPVKKGKKRKSEELEADLNTYPRSLRDKINVPKPSSQAAASGDFASIDAILDDPPPPYSTVAQGRTENKPEEPAQWCQSGDEEMAAFTADYEEEYYVTETRIRTETKKRKSFSQVPSETMLPAQAPLDAHPEAHPGQGPVVPRRPGPGRVLGKPQAENRPRARRGHAVPARQAGTPVPALPRPAPGRPPPARLTRGMAGMVARHHPPAHPPRSQRAGTPGPPGKGRNRPRPRARILPPEP